MPRPSGRIPRSASAPAAPAIAWDLARTAAVVQRAADELDGVRVVTSIGLPLERFRAADGARAAASELGQRSMGTTEEVVCNAVSAASLAYVSGVRRELQRYLETGGDAREGPALGRRLEKLEDWILAGGMRDVLHLTWGGVLEAELPETPLLLRRLSELGLDGEALRWALITFESHAHVRLVWQQAYKLAQSLPDRSAADLLAWGWQGLRIALDKYDPSKGYAFSTYACTRINGSMRDGNRAESPIPKRLTTYVRKVSRTQEALTCRLGRVPTLEELGVELGEDAAGLSMMARLGSAASLDELNDASSDRAPLSRTLVDAAADPAERAIASAQADAIAQALGRLPEEERVAVDLLVYQGLPVSEVRELTGVAPRQLRARKERALASLSQSLAEWAPAS